MELQRAGTIHSRVCPRAVLQSVRLDEVTTSTDETRVRRDFRLLPSEEVEWLARPVSGVPRAPLHHVAVLSCAGVATASVLFAALLRAAEFEGAGACIAVALYAIIFLVGLELWPRYAKDPCEFAMTERRVFWRRGASVRVFDKKALSFARIRWHQSVRGVGSIELVRAVPFGPLMRQERLVLHDLDRPDLVLAKLRNVEERPLPEDVESRVLELLDPDEQVVWGGGPEGWMLGWRDIATALGGVFVVFISLGYASTTFGALASLEEVGLPVGSLVWSLFFAACLVTFVMVASVGCGLVWWGVVRARAEGRDTEYLVTDRRVLIRRGRTVLSLDRSRVFDVAELTNFLGLTHIFFILDGPEGRALGDSGALSGLLPSRDAVPPVLYDVRDVVALRALFGRGERDSLS